MLKLNCNKIYVIESLNSNEKQTGTELYNDFIRWKAQPNTFDCELIVINNKAEYTILINKVILECKNGIIPMIHLEIHTFNDGSGLEINNGDIITFNELANDQSSINMTIANNLFLTMAACYGAYLYKEIKLYRPAPFSRFIGSFDSITVSDLLLRYNEFYTEYLTSF